MKRFFSGICCLAMMLIISIPTMAGEVSNLLPKEPIAIVEDQHAEAESVVEYARGLLQGGECTISVDGSKRVLITATTKGNRICSLIRTEMYLYKYIPSNGSIEMVGGPYRFATANAAYGYASKVVSVPSTGYYLNFTIHTIGNESTTSQTDAVHVTY